MTGINKILFIIPYSKTDTQNHLFNKLQSQINGAKEAGFEVYFTEYDEKNIYLNTENGRVLVCDNVNTNRNIKIYNSIFRSMKKILAICNVDTIYIRRIAAIPSYLSALKYAKKNGIKVLVELPTYPYKKERKESKRKIFYSVVELLDTTIGRYAEKYIDLCPVMGEKTEKVGNVPAINIDNGVDASLYPVVSRQIGKSVTFISVASFCYWHGLDRMIEGMKEYYHSKDDKMEEVTPIYLNVVGNSKDGTIDTLKELVDQNKLDNYVRFYGFKSGKELDEIFNQSDVAIASLGLNRKGLQTSSTLKVREYCARGIPIVYAGNDPCLDRHPDIFLKISEDESPININELIIYVNERVRGKEKQFHAKVREIAEMEMSWKKQFMAINDKLISMKG